MAEETQTKTTPAEEPKKHSLVARLIAAKAFSSIGSTIGILALPVDANSILKGQNLSFGEKIKAVFNGTLGKEIHQQMETLLKEEAKPDSFITKIKVNLKIARFFTIFTAVGIIGGAVLGWVRGGLIEHAGDIFKHPIRSTKIVLGLEKPPQSTPSTESQQTTTIENDIPDTDKWKQLAQSRLQEKQARIEPRGSYREAAAREDNSPAPVGASL